MSAPLALQVSEWQLHERNLLLSSGAEVEETGALVDDVVVVVDV